MTVSVGLLYVNDQFKRKLKHVESRSFCKYITTKRILDFSRCFLASAHAGAHVLEPQP